MFHPDPVGKAEQEDNRGSRLGTRSAGRRLDLHQKLDNARSHETPAGPGTGYGHRNETPKRTTVRRALDAYLMRGELDMVDVTTTTTEYVRIALKRQKGSARLNLTRSMVFAALDEVLNQPELRTVRCSSDTYHIALAVARMAEPIFTSDEEVTPVCELAVGSYSAYLQEVGSDPTHGHVWVVSVESTLDGWRFIAECTRSC